jgi:hypothetical protein
MAANRSAASAIDAGDRTTTLLPRTVADGGRVTTER